MTLRRSIQMIAVVMVGLIAGLMLGTGIEQHSLRALSGSAWVTEHQAMDSWFRVIMPPYWNATALVLVTTAFLSRGQARWMFGFAAALLIASLVVTVRVEVPMNRAIAAWNANAPPGNWAVVRDHWLTFHRLRTVSGILAFVAATFGLMRGSEN